MLAHVLAAAVALVPSSQAAQQVSVRPYASGLLNITAISSTRAERRRLYVVEQFGRIRWFVNGRPGGVFLDIRNRVQSGGEQGLLGLAFHPAYARNHRFYVQYTDNNSNQRIVEFRSRRGRGIPSTERQILFFRDPYGNHNGGQLAFDRNGLLYVGMGDGGAGGDPENRAQRMNDRHGKLLRANPLRRPVRWTIVGLGLRNPWRYSFDRANGDLYIGDVGQGNWEEIDYRPRAQIGALANYGWKTFEGRERYSNTPLGPGQLVAPVHVYGREEGNCTVIGGYVYRGRAVSDAAGRYFFGDYCSGIVWSMRVEDGRATGVRREPFRVAGLTTFGEDVAGELYLGTEGGRVLKLSR